MKNKLTLAKYLIYGSAACFLVVHADRAISITFTLGNTAGWDYLWNEVELWWFLWHFPFTYLVPALLIAFSYQRFQKGKTQFNRGLYAIAIFAFLSYIGKWIYLINGWGWNLSTVFQILEQINTFKDWTTYTEVLGLVALIWGVCLLVFVVDKKIKGRPHSYQKSDEISDKEFIPVILLCFFLGGLGVHRFYSGKIGTGILMILTLGGLGIWVIVDFIMLCIGSFRDIDGKIIRYQRAVYVAPDSHANTPELSKASELEQFYELKNKGVISEEEFNKKKEELLR